QLKRDLKRAGIEIWSVHMPFGREIDLSQTDEAVRQRSVELHRRVLRFCKVLHMTYCLVLYLNTASENILCRSFNVK
ncbi:hypothetical protein OSL57_27650, partial [Escherichia coli]|nr:hypothetical protein [Escherichia coli]